MTISKSLLPVALATIMVIVGARIAQGDEVKEDVKKLLGPWQVTKFVDQSEEPAPADEIKDFTFEFQGDRLTIRKRKDDEGKEMKYSLNASKKPKWIDLDMGQPNSVSEGIYKLDGDELTICVVGGSRGGKTAPRPSEFKASKRNKYSLFVLKRVKK